MKKAAAPKVTSAGNVPLLVDEYAEFMALLDNINASFATGLQAVDLEDLLDEGVAAMRAGRKVYLASQSLTAFVKQPAIELKGNVKTSNRHALLVLAKHVDWRAAGCNMVDFLRLYLPSVGPKWSSGQAGELRKRGFE